MWHSRLGQKDSVPRNPPVCAACQQGKLKATPHPRVPEHTSSAFDLVHADLVPLDGISFGGFKYILLFNEDYSVHTVWLGILFFLEGRSHYWSTDIILTQFNIVIKCRRTDGGTREFLNGLIDCTYKDHGMIHQPSTPYVKQQNGVVERRIQTLKDMERSMRAGAFQVEALATALFLTNLLPSVTLDNR
jgi:hypothetical protein